MLATKPKFDVGNLQLKDQVVAINRVTKVVKGGKNMSFAALVVVGDPASAVVGYGSGKAKEVPQAIRKGIESAKWLPICAACARPIPTRIRVCVTPASA